MPEPSEDEEVTYEVSFPLGFLIIGTENSTKEELAKEWSYIAQEWLMEGGEPDPESLTISRLDETIATE